MMDWLNSFRKKDTYQGDPKVRGQMDKVINAWTNTSKAVSDESQARLDSNNDLKALMKAATKNSNLSSQSQSDIVKNAAKQMARSNAAYASAAASVKASRANSSAAASIAGGATGTIGGLAKPKLSAGGGKIGSGWGVAGAQGIQGVRGMQGDTGAVKQLQPSILSVSSVPDNPIIGDLVFDTTDSAMKMFDGTRWIHVMADKNDNNETIWVHWATVREMLDNEQTPHKRVMMLDNTKQDIFRRFDEGLLEIDAVEAELVTLTDVSDEFNIPMELANLMVVAESISASIAIRNM